MWQGGEGSSVTEHFLAHEAPGNLRGRQKEEERKCVGIGETHLFISVGKDATVVWDLPDTHQYPIFVYKGDIVSTAAGWRCNGDHGVLLSVQPSSVTLEHGLVGQTQWHTMGP